MVSIIPLFQAELLLYIFLFFVYQISIMHNILDKYILYTFTHFKYLYFRQEEIPHWLGGIFNYRENIDFKIKVI